MSNYNSLGDSYDYHYSRLNGFTLLELSIVLVIIGLLAGGITVGADMIRSAELRAVITEHQRYTAAVHTFRDKYFALPGDMTNAQAFWGIAHATPATCITTASTGTETCNGDGDGKIDISSAGSNEMFRFWQHLANAGLIEGSYNGIAGSGNAIDAELVTNINSPTSKLSNAGWSMYYMMYYVGDAYLFAGQYNNYYSYGADTASNRTYDKVLTAEEAWNIDKKIDDGKPTEGQLWAINWSTCTDAADENDLTSDYDLDDSSITCGLAFRNQF